MYAAGPAADDAPCCEAVRAAGERLTRALDAMHVESLWLAKQHVDWETGEPDRSANYEGSARATHCSAFVAAASQRLGVHVLRPPEHGLVLLANAQVRWLASAAALDGGWRAVRGASDAQSLANQGELVVIAYENPNPRRPGHIVIVRPSAKTRDALERGGPDIIQAGVHNHNLWSAREAFRGHPGAWPLGVSYYAHELVTPDR
jgi:hypothetical protein